jgi:hypothetical protein
MGVTMKSAIMQDVTPCSLIIYILPDYMASQTILHYVGFEVITAVVMRSTIFRNITSCSLLKVNRRFGETYRLYLQGRRGCQARHQRESRWQATWPIEGYQQDGRHGELNSMADTGS